MFTCLTQIIRRLLVVFALENSLFQSLLLLSSAHFQEVKDDYIFECEVNGQTQKAKVTIFQSVGDPLFYGKIYSAKDAKSEEDGPDLHLIHPP